MRKTRLGVIGCSGRIQGLLGLSPRFREQVEVAALCDPAADRVAEFKARFNPEAKVYCDHKALCADPSLDWVAVGAWNSLHSEHAACALSAGKDVFCEKPMATDVDGIRLMQAALRGSGRRLMIGFTLRYTEFYRKVKAILDSGAIGDVVSCEFSENLGFNHGGHIMCCWRRKREFTGSHILEKCCHDIDMANWLLGSRARRVASFGGLNFFKPENARHLERLPKNSEGRLPYCSWPTAWGKNPFTSDKDIIDNQVAIIEYESGARATFHTNLNAGIPERRVYILGTEGAVRGDFVAGSLEVRRIGFDSRPELFDFKNMDGHGGGDPILIDYWLRMMSEGLPSLTDIKSGVDSATTCFALDDAMLQGRTLDMTEYWTRVEEG